MKAKYPFIVSEHAIKKYKKRVKEDTYRAQRSYPEIVEIISYSLISCPFFGKKSSSDIHYLVNLRNPIERKEFGLYYILVGQNERDTGREVITIKNIGMTDGLKDNKMEGQPRSAKMRRKYYFEQKPKDLERHLRD